MRKIHTGDDVLTEQFSAPAADVTHRMAVCLEE